MKSAVMTPFDTSIRDGKKARQTSTSKKKGETENDTEQKKRQRSADTENTSLQCISITREEQEFFLNKSAKVRKRFFDLISKSTSDDTPLRAQIYMSRMPEETKVHILRQFLVDPSPKFHQWVNHLLNIPFGSFSKPPELSPFKMIQIREKLDECIVGQEDAKDHILRSVYNIHQGGDLFAVGICGPPGVGKTTFVKKAFSLLGRPVISFGLGGVQDSSYLLGHTYTYEGSTFGRIIGGIIRAGVMDPVFFFDELDKVSMEGKGVDLMNVLVHLTDPVQNNSFQDKYFHGVNFDLSRAIFVFTYNDSSRISPILLDRLEKIKFEKITRDNKMDIVTQHLIPRCEKEFKIKFPSVSNSLLSSFLSNYKEEGVRQIERDLRNMAGNIAVWKFAPDCLKYKEKTGEELFENKKKSSKENDFPSMLYT